jgi:hypothetical protein
MSGKKYSKYRSRAVAVPYFTETVTIRYDWMRRTETMESLFNVTGSRSSSVLYISAVSFQLIYEIRSMSYSFGFDNIISHTVFLISDLGVVSYQTVEKLDCKWF